MRVYMPYSASEIPIAKVFEIENTEYSYLIERNDEHDFYTLTVMDAKDEIIYTTKLVYAGDSLHAGHSRLGVDARIVPFDYSGKHVVVNGATFGEGVRLYVFV
jgi:hypothetical protein